MDHPVNKEWCDVPEIKGLQAVHSRSPNNSQRITKTYRNGVADTVKIKLQYNIELQSTLNHRWWVSQRYIPKYRKYMAVNEWREAQDIQPDDIIQVMPGVYSKSEDACLKTLDDGQYANDARITLITQPAYMSPDFGWLIGYLWGNGAQSPLSRATRFTTQYRTHLEKAQAIMLKLFGAAGKIQRASENRDAWNLDFSSVMLWDFLKLNNIWKYNDDEKKTLANIPKVVRESSVETLLAFFAGLTDADGCVSVDKQVGRPHKRTITMSNAHEEFSRHFQDVALACGLVFGRSHNTRGNNLQQEKSMWLLSLAPHSVPDRFDTYAHHSLKVTEAGRDLPYAHETTTVNRAIMGRVRAVEPGPRVETFDIEVDKEHWYYAGAVKSHNTLSLLAGVTPGAHPGIYPYFIRRIRIAASNPLVQICKAHGYPTEFQMNFDGTEDYKTVVVSFPCSYPENTTFAKDTSAVDQLNVIKRLQNEWSDNAVSVTVYYRLHELPEIREWLAQHYNDNLKTVSFLLHNDHGFKQAPFEEISFETYTKMRESTRPITRGDTIDSTDLDSSSECVNGACPIR